MGGGLYWPVNTGFSWPSEPKKATERGLKPPARKGQKHRDTPMRNFLDPEDEFLERRELLGLG